MKNKIKTLSEERQKFLDKYYASWDDSIGNFGDYTMEEPKEINDFAIEIEKLLKEHRDDLEVDFIIEQLTYLGDAPCLLYDDNGNFAVSGEGFQELNEEPDDMVISHFIEKEMWRPTIREALYVYLDS